MSIAPDVSIPDDAEIDTGVTIHERAILAGPGIVIRKGARLDVACVIAEGVTIDRGAHIRAGAVVLRSVPANAIVEGNPAAIVGYCSNQTADPDLRGAPRHIDIREVIDLPRPGLLPLEVGGCTLYLMRRVTDTRGSLTVAEVPSELPFAPARFFAVFDVPSKELRGEHAHRRCEQFLICLHGSVRVLLDDGQQRCEVTLDRPDLAVHMPAMIWGTQYRYSPDAVLLVFASRPYEPEDYLRTYDQFLDELARLPA